MVVRGRLWRVSNPHLPPHEREALVAALMNARREVRVALAAGDEKRVRAARKLVNTAKVSLGERGPVWWQDGAKDFTRYLVNNTPYQEWYEQLGRPES